MDSVSPASDAAAHPKQDATSHRELGSGVPNSAGDLIPSLLGGLGYSEVIPGVEPYVKLLAHRPSVTIASKYEGIAPHSSTVA